jgi:DNA (cytosine-5)-methyltransferase 1
MSVLFTDIGPYWDNPPKSEMTFVDLFCGCGGLSKGFEMAGLQGICGLDCFEEAGLTYSCNFNHPVVNGDITRRDVKRMFLNTVKEQLAGRELDIVAGGFPCQGFSMSGKREVDDSRNTLYLELIDVVKQLNPKFIVCENVKGLRSMLDGKVEEKILADFKAAGYDTNIENLMAADYFVPQTRTRCIFIGNRLGIANFYPKPLLDKDHYITVGQAIGDLETHPEDRAFNHEFPHRNPLKTQRFLEMKEGESVYESYGESCVKCYRDKPSRTIKENHGEVDVHYSLPRTLTVREMARLQSFPDDFRFRGKPAKQRVQVGNAVPPLLGKAIGLSVRKSAGDL